MQNKCRATQQDRVSWVGIVAVLRPPQSSVTISSGV